MKIDPHIVQDVLQKHVADPDLIRRIFDDVLADAEAQKTPREKQPKKNFVLVVSDPNGVIPKGTELTGWAVQIDEEKSILSIPDSLQRIAHDFNASKKGLKLPAKSIGEVFESAAAKHFNEHGVHRKHKEASFMIVTDNQIQSDGGT